MRKKDGKVGKKTAYKKKGKWKKKRERKKLETNSKKKLANAHTRKTKMLPSNEQKFKSWVLEISLLAIPMLTGRKTVRKEGFGPKGGFFRKNWLTAKSFKQKRFVAKHVNRKWGFLPFNMPRRY